ncbi:VanW family protein [Virgibacillus sp. SK37]|uniref:VanW family protein n=1 Tax=Virgibacillus sp. SK37 TaxID=403957 RepID=UPI00069363D7|nr:VanW family protein [Virgibacillus sp. SK37]
MKKIYPRIDRSLLEEIRGKELGNYVTYYKENNKERSHNISLAANAINNYVLFPGETFSFNKVVGERTKEKGYKRAPVIVKGELAEDIGGGICQVSSTLFNAVDLKGIQIVERYAHSREVPYVPPGKDATVSWWGPDFVFKNMYNQPILIRASSKNGKMNIRVYSSESATYFKGNTSA